MSTIRKTKLFLSFAGFIIIIVSTAAHTIAFRESPLKNEMNLNDLQKNDIKVKYIEHSSSWDKTFYEKFASDILGAAKECDYVFLVQPTEKIYFNPGEVSGKDVLCCQAWIDLLCRRIVNIWYFVKRHP